MKAKTIGIGVAFGAAVVAAGYFWYRSRDAGLRVEADCSACKKLVTAGRIRAVNQSYDSPCVECAEVAEASQVSAINNLTQLSLQEMDASKRADWQAQIADYPNQLALLKRRASEAQGVSGYFQ
jgi:hypothetical protein